MVEMPHVRCAQSDESVSIVVSRGILRHVSWISGKTCEALGMCPLPFGTDLCSILEGGLGGNRALLTLCSSNGIVVSLNELPIPTHCSFARQSVPHFERVGAHRDPVSGLVFLFQSF